MDEAKYATAHGGKKFVRPVRLPLYDKLIADDAPTVVRVRAEAAHKSKLEDYNNYKAAERGCAKFLRDVVNEVWYNDLKDAETFYTQVTALEIMTFLDLNSGGLHIFVNRTLTFLSASAVSLPAGMFPFSAIVSCCAAATTKLSGETTGLVKYWCLKNTVSLTLVALVLLT
jgi:hypothetical protein